MRSTLLAAALALATLLPASGCVPFGCGGFDGAGDTVYRRDTESLILCGNGGFVATLTDWEIEGYYAANAPDSAVAGVGTRGEDGLHIFDLYVAADGTASTPGLGDGAWEPVALDPTALDHADVQCADLEQRDWWTTP